MKRIMQVMFAVALLGAATVANGATISQAGTGFTDREKAAAAYKSCFVYEIEHTASGQPLPHTLKVLQWDTTNPICHRTYWLLARSCANESYKNNSPLLGTLMCTTLAKYERDPAFAAVVDGFEQRLLNGDYDDDPYINNLIRRLPIMRKAEVQLGGSGWQPVLLESLYTYCVDRNGNDVMVDHCDPELGYRLKFEYR